MPRNLFIFNSKNFPVSLSIAVLLLLISELIARAYAPFFMPMHDYLMFYKRDRMIQKVKPFENAILIGDSRAMSIDARALSSHLTQKLQRPFRVYNYAFPAIGAEGYYLFLKKFLHHNQAPEVVFFCVRPLMLAGNALVEKNSTHSHKHRFFSLFSIGEYRETLNLKFFFKSLPLELRERLILITYRASIESFIKSFLKGEPLEDKISKNIIIESMNGGIPLEGPRLINIEEIRESPEWLDKLFIDPDALFWFEKFLQLAKDQRITVVIFNIPSVKDVYEKREQNGENALYQAAMGELKTKYGLKIVEPLLEVYEYQYFADDNHLNEAGDRLFLEQLTQRLSQTNLERH